MNSKPLSMRAGFSSAVVLKAEYWSSPSNCGECEFAVRTTREGVELWQWTGDYPPERIFVLPPHTNWRDVVKRIAGNELVGATIDPATVEITGCDRRVAEVISLAWSANKDDQQIALLLSCLDNTSFDVIGTTRSSLLSAGLRAVINELGATAFRHEVTIDEIGDVSVRQPDLMAIRAAYRRALARCLRYRRAQWS